MRYAILMAVVAISGCYPQVMRDYEAGKPRTSSADIPRVAEEIRQAQAKKYDLEHMSTQEVADYREDLVIWIAQERERERVANPYFVNDIKAMVMGLRMCLADVDKEIIKRQK